MKNHTTSTIGKAIFFSFLLVFVLLIVGIRPSAAAVSNDDCMACHDDKDLSYVKFGVKISLHVTDKALEGTPHEGFDCVDCHTDLKDVEDFPHRETLALPDCGACHEEAQKEYVEGFFHSLREKGFT
ncbi:MAG: hypothetical protein GY950_06410 [bacterium]|nr:hypothetical protein [bacterium]